LSPTQLAGEKRNEAELTGKIMEDSASALTGNMPINKTASKSVLYKDNIITPFWR
jgi:hypothetical protein